MTTMWYVQKKVVFNPKGDCHQAVSTGLEHVALASCVDYEPYAKKIPIRTRDRRALLE